MTITKNQKPQTITNRKDAMEKYYFTVDSDYKINEHAKISIVEASNVIEAEKIIIDEFKKIYGDLEEGESLTLEHGEYDDCWIKTHDADFAEEAGRDGVDGIPCRVQRPGTHPGGRSFWITPAVDVYVPKIDFKE